MPTTTTPAPFLRWAGGKRRLLPALLAARPASYGNYHEPFLGGGAMFFALGVPGARAHLSDLTGDLVAAYQAIQQRPQELIDALTLLGADTSKDAYLAVRASAPTTPLEQAARFVYLNRTCFNGLYRVNSRGQFNVPYGQLANPTVCDAPLLRAVHTSLVGAHITHAGYQDALQHVRSGDFVYLDPPYLPASTTSSFSQYTRGDFTRADHETLAEHIQQVVAQGAHVMLSNADTPDAREIFADLHLHTVRVTRSIAARAGARGRVSEILATSYPSTQMADPATLVQLSI